MEEGAPYRVLVKQSSRGQIPDTDLSCTRKATVSVLPCRIFGFAGSFPTCTEVFPFHWNSQPGVRTTLILQVGISLPAAPAGPDGSTCLWNRWKVRRCLMTPRAVFHYPNQQQGAGGSIAAQSGSELQSCLTQKSENTSTELLWPLKWLQS